MPGTLAANRPLVVVYAQFVAVLQAAMFRAAPAGQMGTASGLVTTARYLGTIGSASAMAS